MMRHYTYFALVLIISTVFSGCRSTQQDTNLEANRAAVRKYHDIMSNVFNGRLAELDNIMAPDYIYHTMSGKDHQGREALKKAITQMRKPFPDEKEEIMDIVAEGDKVVSRYRSTATYKGKYKDIDATGKKVVTYAVSIFKVVNGKITEEWQFMDPAEVDKQLTARN